MEKVDRMRPAFFRSYVDAVNAFEAGREGDMALAGSFGINVSGDPKLSPLDLL